jgi:hypothetical protein
MELGPIVGRVFNLVGTSLDKIDQIEADIKTSDTSLKDKALDKGKEVASAVVDKGKDLAAAALEKGKEVTSSVVETIVETAKGPPRPSPEDERQAKIERLDEIIGRKDRRDD